MVNRLAPPENTVFIVPNVNLLDFLYRLKENKKGILSNGLKKKGVPKKWNGRTRPCDFFYPISLRSKPFY